MDNTLLIACNSGRNNAGSAISLQRNGKVGRIVEYAARVAGHNAWYARGRRVAVDDEGNSRVYAGEQEKKSQQHQWNTDEERAARSDAWPPAPP